MFGVQKSKFKISKNGFFPGAALKYRFVGLEMDEALFEENMTMITWYEFFKSSRPADWIYLTFQRILCKRIIEIRSADKKFSKIEKFLWRKNFNDSEHFWLYLILRLLDGMLRGLKEIMVNEF